MNDFALVVEEVTEIDFAVYRELIRFGVCVLHWIKDKTHGFSAMGLRQEE
jgi:hypothetical protein